eukprot:g7188.t1
MRGAMSPRGPTCQAFLRLLVQELAESQLKSLRGFFLRLDCDSDGVLSASDLGTGDGEDEMSVLLAVAGGQSLGFSDFVAVMLPFYVSVQDAWYVLQDMLQVGHDVAADELEDLLAGLPEAVWMPQEELINGQGATKLSGLLRPHQPSLLAESVDPCPEPAVLLEELPVVSAPPSREISRHPTNISSNSRKTSKNIRSEHTQILKTQTSLTARSHSLREKAAAYVDYLAAFLVLLNSAVMMLELELEGRAIGRNLALSEGPQLQETGASCMGLHGIYEIVIRGLDFFRDVANWFDVVLVLAGLLEVFFIGGRRCHRTGRPRKAFRAVRMVRTFRLFKGLQLLVKACTCFLPSLGWSMVLLVVFMSIGTLVLGNLLQDFITNESNNLEDRHWIWNRYGTAYRAMYTLYETLGCALRNWPTNARPVLEKVSQGFVVFFVLSLGSRVGGPDRTAA